MSEIIVALDVPDRERALRLVERLGDTADFYKVGLQLYTAWGPDAVRELRGLGKRVFLDLKLHDIPNTVAEAVRSARELGVELLTVHAAGGRAMLGSAAAAAAERGGTRLLAVTVLTSMDSSELGRTWGRDGLSVEEEVVRLGRMAVEAGLDGLVASGEEAPRLRREFGPRMLIVTPGIRLAGGGHHDQLRVLTPGEAVARGADHLVVGRAVTSAPDPVEALRQVRREAGAA